MKDFTCAAIMLNDIIDACHKLKLYFFRSLYSTCVLQDVAEDDFLELYNLEIEGYRIPLCTIWTQTKKNQKKKKKAIK